MSAPEGHVAVLEEIMLADCFLGECDHDEECEPQTVTVCSGCVMPGPEEDFDLLVPWTYAEEHGHVLPS